MKRDMEIVRMLLLQEESGEEQPELKQFEELLLVYNIALMVDAGLVEAIIVPDANGAPVSGAIIRLTWAGHDFLDSSRDETI